MKIRVPYVKVTAVRGCEVHDICFIDTEGMKVLSSDTETKFVPLKGGVV